MAYSLKLAKRIRAELTDIPCIERKMFGGVGFLIHGNMACGVHKEDMIVRVDPEKYEKLLKKPGAKIFDLTGKPMKGWLLIEAVGAVPPNNSTPGSKKALNLRWHCPPSNP